MAQTNHAEATRVAAGLLQSTPGDDYGANGSRKEEMGPSRPRNLMLAALPRAVWERLAPHVRHALLIPGQALVEADSLAGRVYFPNSGLISLAMTSADGAQVEIGMIGREGTTGTLDTLMGSAPTARALVQIAGNACWLPLATLRSEFNSDADLRFWLLRYWEVLGVQTAQSALCNRLHTVEERLARWLLLVRDRIASDEIEITHEFIAHTLGARRSGVTVALGTLQQAGLIDCTRGKITVLNAEQLAASSCECYVVVHERFRQLECTERAAIDNRHGGTLPENYATATLFRHA
jgi:CRP-like cAMP-binding protein